MTKKSLNRQMRDKAKKEQNEELLNNNTWSELNDLHRDCVNLLLGASQLGLVLNNKDLLAEVEDLPTLNTNIRILTSDIKTLKEELNLIQATHAGKTGDAAPEEILLGLEIYEKYQTWMTRHGALVQPTTLHILEQTNVAETKMLAKQQLADPNIVSDAEFTMADEVKEETAAVAE